MVQSMPNTGMQISKGFPESFSFKGLLLSFHLELAGFLVSSLHILNHLPQMWTCIRSGAGDDPAVSLSLPQGLAQSSLTRWKG